MKPACAAKPATALSLPSPRTETAHAFLGASTGHPRLSGGRPRDDAVSAAAGRECGSPAPAKNIVRASKSGHFWLHTSRYYACP